MKDFEGKIAVITGGGTGMGRELARQLVSEGCHTAICDIQKDPMRETEKRCRQEAKPGTRLTTHECDVSQEDQVAAFCAAVKDQHQTDHINLLFNNAGIGGGGSFLLDDRRDWDRVFSINWFGVYFSTRAFLPLLLASREGHLINISSVNGFWACLGPSVPHTAYCTSKFAVKGFTEALQIDLRLFAPHVKASLVMPGHIGTSISVNANKILGKPSIEEMNSDELALLRERLKRMLIPTDEIEDEALRELVRQNRDDFLAKAPLTAAQGAQIILDGVRNEKWRILVGEDAEFLDQMVRQYSETAYEGSFVEKLVEEREKRGNSVLELFLPKGE
ncbi:MAG: SDR family oxidoreductase [Deltaproteobacteria bacterium]|nr:SDR family oxidoreductase [Deltaproteobacteria bacterium]